MSVYRPKKSKFYWIDFYFEGERYRESSGSTRKRDAENFLAKRKLDIREGKYNPAAQQKDNTFEDFFPSYMEWAEDEKKASTIERNHQFYKHLKPYVAKRKLTNITLVLAERYKKDRKKQEASNATINRERSFLKAVLNKAVEWEEIQSNPLKYLKPLPEKDLFNRYLQAEETLALIDAADPHFRPMLVTAIFTGFRWGTVVNLKWSEIDLQNSVIALENPPKNGDGTFPLPAPVKDELVKMKKNGIPFIFTNPKTGEPWKNLRRSFKKAKLKAGITRPFRFHDLRHSFASNLVMAGVDMKTVQELLGHRNITTSMRYTHLSKEHKQKAVDDLFKKDE